MMRYAPSLDRLLHYRRSWLRLDVIAGVTVAAYLIPQVMAYAEVAGLPPVAERKPPSWRRRRQA